MLGEGQGVAEAMEVAVAVGRLLAEALLEGLEPGETVALGETEALAAGLAQKDGAGPRIVWFTFEAPLPPPLRSRAAGTTRMPRMTVATKANAPHS